MLKVTGFSIHSRRQIYDVYFDARRFATICPSLTTNTTCHSVESRQPFNKVDVEWLVEIGLLVSLHQKDPNGLYT